jgi:hypothetical protein|tara:strand:- start:1472 stop:2470 length:999 start_codon:yes stop_codon:yes gene_type:complete
MRKDLNKEKDFQEAVASGEFNFSYSSLNKLIFSPQLFYKDYILKIREERTDKHLVQGKLIHLLILQPEEFDNNFVVMPSKLPSDTLRRVLKNIMLYTDATELSKVEDKLILDSLKEVGLYQSLKDEDKRVAKVRTTECEDYYTFSQTTGKDIIDTDTLEKCKDSVELIKENKSIMELLSHEVTDFEMDGIEVFNEKYLKCTLEDYDFGLHGYVDRYVIDRDKKVITIIDVKTTGKTIADFPETVEFYNYWLQAAVYRVLVTKNIDEKLAGYKINFNFIVIDKYNQMYNFPVKDTTMVTWGDGLKGILGMVNYHVKENRFDLPYDFLTKTMSL